MSEPPDITGRILVASSSPLTVNALSKVLESDDVEVVKARHGDEAVSCLLDVQIDLAFVQDILPGRTGLEICEQFARGRNDRQIPFVVFSRRPDMKQAALECGAVGFLKVPCRPEDVFDVIRNLDTPLTAMPSPSEVTRPDLPLKEVDATQAHPMILLVDDSDMIHNHVETIFKDTGYLLAHAYDGVEGLSEAKRLQPDMIISDIDMPNMDGFDMCSEIRKAEEIAPTPILILSARGSGVDIDRGFDVGANDYLTKPFAEFELLTRLELILSSAQDSEDRRERVLVVEDSSVQRNLIVQGLAQQGFDVISAEHGEEGIRLAREHRPDLIVTDAEMPVMSGRDLTRALRQDDDLSDIPILMLAAADSDVSRTKGHHAGISAYLTKPFVADKMVVIAEKLIAERRLIREREELLEHTRQLESTNRDLDTARSEAEDARAEADAANEAKSAFLANMSHEIRTPMNAILGFSDILSSTIDAPQERSYLDAIRTGGKSLLGLINDILDLSKVEAGKLELEYAPCDVGALCRDMEQIFVQKTEEKGIALIVDVDPGFPEHLILDELRLRQVLINLIGNGIKFTETGHVRLHATGSVADGEAQVAFAVEDTGLGIPDDQQDKIFGAFEQTAGQSTAKFGGTGLGLAISKKLAQMMGGDIRIESTFGEGSTFFVELPSLKVPGEEERAGTDLDTLPSIRFDPATVLVVDDIDDNRLLVKTYLTEFGLDVAESGQGEEAQQVADEMRPSLVLMDFKMPDPDAESKVTAFKTHPGLEAVPVIALTASAMREEEEALREICDGFLAKPVNQVQMIRELAEHLPNQVVDAEVASDEPEASVFSIEEIDADHRARLVKLRTQLESEMDHWKEISATLTINDVEIFASRMQEVAHQAGYPPLAEWAEHLTTLAATFDMGSLPTVLEGFPDLIEPLQELEGGDA